MRDFSNILYVSNGVDTDGTALQQALQLAATQQADLTLMIALPAVPEPLAEYRATLESAILTQMQQAVEKCRQATGTGASTGGKEIRFIIEAGDPAFVHIIQRVLRDNHDLVIKDAEAVEGGFGFRSVDMSLLRKCPCPVWLCRPDLHINPPQQHIAVAIDPEDAEPAARELSIRLLQLGARLSQQAGGMLHVVSCWELEYEGYLRNHALIHIDEDKIQQSVLNKEQQHLAQLQALVAEACPGSACNLHHPKGRADQLIPAFINDNKIDLLIMGTVARTGIPGFIVGNTAENVLQQVSCSMLAIKPRGFLSPISIS